MRDMRRWAAIAAGFALVVALAGCSGTTGTTGGGGGGGGTKVTVVEKGYRFVPAQITAPTGADVVFDNQDAVPHHVVVGSTDLGIQSPGQSVTFKAAKDGSYAVRCLIHPTMIGQLTVGAGGGQTQPPAGGGSSAPSGGSGSSGGYGY